ncbi:hypothetical protein DRP05_15305 [Archaeoglobales archaeon]|nr:MAG: hypothetical protein DRP05_15305 [Archaeoglobales archaeon]
MFGGDFMSEVLVVNHSELVEIVKKVYEEKLSTFIWGRTGVGKSQSVRRAAKEIAEKYGLKYVEWPNWSDPRTEFVLIDIRLSHVEPSDLIGMPKLVDEEGVTKWYAPNWLKAISKEKEKELGIKIRGILFLDELNLAPPLVQNASYQLVLDRRLGEVEVADGIAIIAAGNLTEDQAYTFDMPLPLRTRFVHATLRPPTIDEWVEWAKENGIDSRIIAFLKMQPSMLFKEMSEDRTFPTPRGWEFASKLIANERDAKKAAMYVAMACGVVAGTQFKAFLKLSETIDLKELLENPERFDSLSMDIKYSAVVNMPELLISDRKMASKLLKFAVAIPPEFAVLLLMSMKQVMGEEAFKDALKRFRGSEAKELIKLIRFLL